jgi:hypothetical protein
LRDASGIGKVAGGKGVNKAMKGDRVIVRAYGDVPLVRRVWGADENAVYVTDEATMAKLSRGADGPFPIGFPREDVFHYEPEVAARIGRGLWDWSSLSRY